ncbi:MAG: NAD-binding protein [Catenulispora sp.]|nr:NAD-binding protein [Catenulispora sp.]
MDQDVDARVVVVGAGPTGLLLAGDLAEAGVPVTLVERRHAGLSNLSRALVVHATTLEAFDARGLAQELIGKGAPVRALRLFDTAVVDVSELPTPYPYLLVVPQYETEAVLQARLDRLGVRTRYETEVVGLRQDAGGVALTVRDADGTHEERAAYVVGTDGHKSSIRRLLGVEFPGHTVVASVMLVDAVLSDPPELRIATNTDGDKFAFVAPFKDGYHRIIAWDQSHPKAETEPVDIEEVRAVLRATLGTDFGMGEPRWSSRFHSDERQAEHYRVGRVFLAGDAAHTHSPAGGQGMNTGLLDAANLSWKLAAVLRGRADAALLDTYESERYPVGTAVIKGSGRLLRAAQIKATPARRLRNLAMHFALSRPLVNRRIGLALSGLWIKYPVPAGAHELTGHQAGDVPLDGSPARLFEALRGGSFVLLAPADLHEAAAKAGVRAAVPTDGGPVRLVRPDGYIAWAADAPSAEEVTLAIGASGA